MNEYILNFDPATASEENFPIDDNYPLGVVITNNKNVFPKTKMPKRVENSKYSDELNSLLDICFVHHNWYEFCEFTFPMWDRVNQPHNYNNDEEDIDGDRINEISDFDYKIIFLEAFKNGLSFKEFLECANERNDGKQYWYFIDPVTNTRDVLKMKEFIIEKD